MSGTGGGGTETGGGAEEGRAGGASFASACAFNTDRVDGFGDRGAEDGTGLITVGALTDEGPLEAAGEDTNDASAACRNASARLANDATSGGCDAGKAVLGVGSVTLGGLSVGLTVCATGSQGISTLTSVTGAGLMSGGAEDGG